MIKKSVKMNLITCYYLEGLMKKLLENEKIPEPPIFFDRLNFSNTDKIEWNFDTIKMPNKILKD